MWEINGWRLFLLGGPLMWPILLASIFAAAIVIERAVFFHGINEDTAALKDRIFTAVRKNDVKTAMMACDLSGTPAAKVLKSGLLQYGRGKEDIEAAMEAASRFEVPLLETRLPALAAIGQVLPLLGLLGTVTGMCALFHTMSMRSQAMNQLTAENISRGVWEALITTEAGLVAAIPCVLAYSCLSGFQARYVYRMEKTAADLADFCVRVTGPVSGGVDDDGG